MAQYPWEASYPPGVKWQLDVPDKTIHQILEESCAQYADRPFTDFYRAYAQYQVDLAEWRSGRTVELASAKP